MVEIFEFPVAKGQTEATAPPVNENPRRQLADLHFADEIDILTRRCSGLEMAAMGADNITGGELGGVIQLAADLVDGMKHLATAFEAERQLRIWEERQ